MTVWFWVALGLGLAFAFVATFVLLAITGLCVVQRAVITGFLGDTRSDTTSRP